MDSRIDIIKGVHPSKFIERELNKQNISLDTLAKGTDIPFQKISAIIAGEYNPTTEEFSKIEDVLKLENGFLSVLQHYSDIEQSEIKSSQIFTQHLPVSVNLSLGMLILIK